MNIDLRSDTVTKPTLEMKQFMFDAEVGDDVFGEDPSINALEAKAADMFGKEAALYCPSGTMTNQIAIMLHAKPGDQVICHQDSHVHLYEGGGVAANAGASVKTLPGNQGKITSEQVRESINADNVHFPHTALVSLENSTNKGGGACYELEEIAAIAKVCKKNEIPLHLDGARVFNALVAKHQSPAELGQYFDTISVCLSKGLGASVGSVLLGTKKQINEARRIRKRIGGGMRQAGIIAAGGLYALDHHIERLDEDHERAHIIATTLKKCSYVLDVLPVETNIVIFKIREDITNEIFLKTLEEKGVKTVGMGPQLIRFVTHLDFTEEMLKKLTEILPGLF
ncbi:MAG: GntG family PLP-dependent aldolase [Candidatus Gracilibacteria bacterium]|nr:GntG family PLP-dependent aldolase [Candidatus Gracilibacteria bacterium]